MVSQQPYGISQMKLIPVGDRFAKVSDRDFAWLRSYKWRLDIRDHTIYAATSCKNHDGIQVTLRMHAMIKGTTYKGRSIHVDHRDGDGLNNQRRNLRIANNFLNHCNSTGRIRTRTLPKGIQERPFPSRYMSRIRKHGVDYYLGSFSKQARGCCCRLQ